MSRVLAGVAEFFADDAAEGGFEGLVGAANVLLQGLIDQSLVIAAASSVDLLAEPVENVVIKADGDASLALRDGEDRAALSSAEIVFTPSSLCAY